VSRSTAQIPSWPCNCLTLVTQRQDFCLVLKVVGSYPDRTPGASFLGFPVLLYIVCGNRYTCLVCAPPYLDWLCRYSVLHRPPAPTCHRGPRMTSTEHEFRFTSASLQLEENPSRRSDPSAGHDLVWRGQRRQGRVPGDNTLRIAGYCSVSEAVGRAPPEEIAGRPGEMLHRGNKDFR
jgi:hypothetical protein